MTKVKFKNHTLRLNRPHLMGILNITPDSFFDGNQNNTLEKALSKINSFKKEKASIIDIGAESTKPGTKSLSYGEEKKRLEPILKQIKKKFPNLIFSLDTQKPEIAEMGFFYGIQMINDITGLTNKNMREIIIKNNGAACIMHMQNKPENMQENPCYTDVVTDVFNFLKNQISIAKEEGIHTLLADPGIGFGKNVHHNLSLIKNIQLFHQLNTPILMGVSRKSFIGHFTKDTAENRLSGTLAACLFCYTKGVQFLRVHDVLEVKKALKIFREIENAK